MVKEATRSLVSLERTLNGREWIGGSHFTVADILFTTVLRMIRHTDIIKPYPHLKSYYERALARPAWQRTLKSYSDRLGVSVADIS